MGQGSMRPDELIGFPLLALGTLVLVAVAIVGSGVLRSTVLRLLRPVVGPEHPQLDAVPDDPPPPAPPRADGEPR